MNTTGRWMLFLKITPTTTREQMERKFQFWIKALHPDKFAEDDKAQATDVFRELLFARDAIRQMYSRSIPPPPPVSGSQSSDAWQQMANQIVGEHQPSERRRP